MRIGVVRFKTLQRYSNGKVVRWISTSPDSENPSPAVRLAEDVVPQDIVSVHGEKVPGAASAGRHRRPRRLPVADRTAGATAHARR